MFACGFVRIWLDSNGTEKNSDLHMNDTGWANCIHCQCCTLSHWARTNKVVAKISFWLHQFNRKHHVHCITVGGYRIRDLVQCACINLLSFFFLSVSSAVFCFEYITLFLCWQKSSDSCKRYCCALCVWVCTDYSVIVVVAEGRNQQSLQYFSKIVHAFACSHVIQTRSSKRLSLALDEQNE